MYLGIQLSMKLVQGPALSRVKIKEVEETRGDGEMERRNDLSTILGFRQSPLWPHR